MNSESVINCPNCHAPIPPEAPQGLCPKCLLAAASIPTDAGQRAGAASVPSLESVSATFPQLEILEFIGQGGMGLVFKARQPKLDRLVALKLLPQKPGADPSFCERFNREARVLARLSHPNIVAVHDFGEAGSFFYLLMEFVDGVNLRQALRAGRFSPAQALSLVPKICDALQYAHEEGVLHRDIKPENLLLDTRGRVKIADFGIAKLLGEPRDITLTARGGAIGTPHYMAPEQLETPHDVDQRADVYSLGVVFYEMLTGELPIGRFAPPSEKAPMDPRVDQVVLRTLEKERERRFPSAGEVKTHVEKITATAAGSPAQRELATPNGKAGGGQAPPVIPGFSHTQIRQTASARYSWSAVAAAVLVGLSFFMLVPALVVSMRVGPNEVILFCLLIGLFALVGTIVAWVSLRRLKNGAALRGEQLALSAAIAWPLVVISFLVVLTLVLSVVNLQSHLFQRQSEGLTIMTLLVGILGAVVLDTLAFRHCSRRWRASRALPHEELLAAVRRMPGRVLWASVAGFCVLALFFLFRPGHSRPFVEPDAAPAAQAPNVPPGYEVGAGELPGNDDRVFRSNLAVPPGYALTIAPVLLSNQLPVRPLLPNGAVLVVPEGQPVHAQLAWHLLGGTTLADGAPLQFSLSLLGAQHGDKSFHVVTPEPLVIDWVAEPAQLWPPQNGHTRFVLMKGVSTSSSADSSMGTEWAIVLEERLDPIPENAQRQNSSPEIVLGTNWPPMERALEHNPAERTPGAEANLAPADQLNRYLGVCHLLEKLLSRKQDLLVQFTPENAWVKQLQEEISYQQELKRQLESENPSLARIRNAKLENELPAVR